ncbi:hypothetical protein [Achromobacter denitrificans]|uniref:hypothetical protein n=1 Tax=Achromobacter denitrificans TaxID=32002 RepID=UPI0020C63420|nr:hypothetical protein [Achromobacter denitrificans]
MTNQNNAAQAVDQEIEAIMEQAQVFASAWSFLGGPFDNGSGLETAEREKANLRALLSKLRAPVADERAAFEAKFPLPAHCQWIGNGYAATEYNAWDAHKHTDRWDGWQARAALASAPVAGEEQPVAYLHTSNRTLTWPGKLTEVQLNSGVWRSLYDRPAAPQASEAVRDADIPASLAQLVAAVKGMTKLYPHVWDRTDGGLVVFPENVARFDAAFDALRIAVGEAVDDDETAALAAQPAEKPATSAPSPVASQRQAMVPGSQESGKSHTDGGAVYE